MCKATHNIPFILKFSQTTWILHQIDFCIGNCVCVWNKCCHMNNLRLCRYDAAYQPLRDTGHHALDQGVLGCQDQCILGSQAQMQGRDETEPPGLVADTRTTACTYWKPSSPPLSWSKKEILSRHHPRLRSGYQGMLKFTDVDWESWGLVVTAVNDSLAKAKTTKSLNSFTKLYVQPHRAHTTNKVI